MDIGSSLVLLSYVIFGTTVILQGFHRPQIDKKELLALQAHIDELEKAPRDLPIVKQEIPAKMIHTYYRVRPVDEIPIIPNNPEKDKAVSKKLRIATIALFVGVIIGFGIYFGVF